MIRKPLSALALVLALTACEEEKPTFIDDPRSHMPQAPVAGNADQVWGAAAVGYAESLYYIYRRGGHADLAPLATQTLIDALREGRMPPVDPLCDCTVMDRLTIDAETIQVIPGQGAKVLVAVNNMGLRTNVYLYLSMTPLGFKIDDIATNSLRQGLAYYLRSNKKTEEEILNERIARIERGECDSLEEC